MNKKTLFVIVFLSMFLTLPAFSGQAAVSPEEIGGNDLSADAAYDFDGNTVEIIEQSPEETHLLLNNTYLLELVHNDTNLGVKCINIAVPPGFTTQAEDFLFDVDFETDPVDGQTLTFITNDFGLELTDNPTDNWDWSGSISGTMDVMDFGFNETGEFSISDGVNSVDIIDKDTVIINDGLGPGGAIVYRINETAWEIFSPVLPLGLITVNVNLGFLTIVYGGPTVMPVPVAPLPAPIINDGILVITYGYNGLCIEWSGYTIYIHTVTLVLIFDYIVITWYFAAFIERIIILIWDITIIIYLTIVELIFVIIYYTFEIKFYETQMVIIYEYIEITIVFIAIFIWEFTFLFIFEFWWIELIFITFIDIFVIQPVQVIFVPVIVPVFVPMIYYVPVMINLYITIYLPMASPELFIEVESEELQKPNHTLQYFVHDAAGMPVNDATVTVSYAGHLYLATFSSSGHYDVEVVAADYPQTITVTATKAWYPDAVLTYYQNITWIDETITETVTAPSPLPIVSVIASLFAVSIGTMVINKKKKK